MSEAMDSGTDQVRVYVPLLNEGTDVVRPVMAEALGLDDYRFGTPDSYDPAVEEWKYPPGSVVRCLREIRNGTEVLVARQRLDADTK
jgi:hypothetical protein